MNSVPMRSTAARLPNARVRALVDVPSAVATAPQCAAAPWNTSNAPLASPVESMSDVSAATVAGWWASAGEAFTAVMASATRPSSAASCASMALDNALEVGFSVTNAWSHTQPRCYCHGGGKRAHGTTPPHTSRVARASAVWPWRARMAAEMAAIVSTDPYSARSSSTAASASAACIRGARCEQPLGQQETPWALAAYAPGSCSTARLHG